MYYTICRLIYISHSRRHAEREWLRHYRGLPDFYGSGNGTFGSNLRKHANAGLPLCAIQSSITRGLIFRIFNGTEVLSANVFDQSSFLHRDLQVASWLATWTPIEPYASYRKQRIRLLTCGPMSGNDGDYYLIRPNVRTLLHLRIHRQRPESFGGGSTPWRRILLAVTRAP